MNGKVKKASFESLQNNLSSIGSDYLGAEILSLLRLVITCSNLKPSDDSRLTSRQSVS